MLPLQGPWVRSLIGELRSHMPHGATEKKKKENYKYFRRENILNTVNSLFISSLTISYAKALIFQLTEANPFNH